MRLFFLLLTLFLVSCNKESHVPDDVIPDISNNIIVRNNITENTTWETGNVYQLSGRISVVEGVTLTIEKGVIIKGEEGTGANASLLLVSRGARIEALGTRDAPIIFTSVTDEISPEDIEVGVFRSPNLNPTISGLWGGVIILGYAPISASNDVGDVSQVQIEGIPTSDPLGLYGGNIVNDNSGILEYVSIRHGGTNIGSGNEINGLTLGGVGSQTHIENIEIIANQDDGIEFFGGSVNVSNIVVWNVGDDAIDTDQAWTGTLDNFMVVSPQGHCFELDGPEGSMIGDHTIKNGEVVASNEIWESMDLINTDNSSRVNLENIYFTEIRPGQKIKTEGIVTFNNIFLNVDSLSHHIEGDIIPEGIQSGTYSSVNKSTLSWAWVFY
jgi:hypothetical protein